MTKSKTHLSGYQVRLKFQLTQHSGDEQLIRSLVEFFGCGNVYLSRESVNYCVENFADLTEKIIPFYNKHAIIGVKFLDFSDFCRVALLMKGKKHRTQLGLDQIRLIKAGMNYGRLD